MGTLESLFKVGQGLSSVILMSDTGDMKIAPARTKKYEALWKAQFPDMEASIELDIDRALDMCKPQEDGDTAHVLVTGSLYLIGRLLKKLT